MQRKNPNWPGGRRRITGANETSLMKPDRFLSYLSGAVIVANATAAFASPTAADFQTCHARAAAILQACLDAQIGRRDNECWDQSRAAHRACYDMVTEIGKGPSPEKRKRIEEAMQRQP
jgi:hypothetical protein